MVLTPGRLRFDQDFDGLATFLRVGIELEG